MAGLYIIIIRHLVYPLLLFGVFLSCQGQTFFTKTGQTKFVASEDTFEPVKATNNSSSALLKGDTGEIAALVFIRAFHFKVALMEEHFNENYMSSDKYPKASFKGKIDRFNLEHLSSEKKQELPLKGVLIIGGKEIEITTKAKLRKMGDSIRLWSSFTIRPEDFDIKIPNIVRNKIAKQVNVILTYDLVKKN